jgi:hypothetical protein
MESNLVLCAIHSEQPVAELVKLGAIPSEMMLRTWRVLDGIKAIASPAPDYQSATVPKTGAEYTMIGGVENRCLPGNWSGPS